MGRGKHATDPFMLASMQMRRSAVFTVRRLRLRDQTGDWWYKEFQIYLHARWGGEMPEIVDCSNRQFGLISADDGQK
jgi:hypothetical protein